MMKIFKRMCLFLLMIFLISLISCRSVSPVMESTSSEKSDKFRLKIDSLEKELRYTKDQLQFHQNAEAGQMFGRCASRTQFETIQSSPFPIYTGNNFDTEGVMIKEIKVSESYADWFVVNRADICNEIYANEKDCAIWQYKKFPAEYKTIFVVRDTSILKEFEFQSFALKKVIKKGKLFDRYLQYHCPPDPRPKFVKRIQDALMQKGYYLIGHGENDMDAITKSALFDFQKRNGLKVGQIDFETLEALGIQR